MRVLARLSCGAAPKHGYNEHQQAYVSGFASQLDEILIGLEERGVSLME